MLLRKAIIFFAAVVPLAAQGIPPNPTPAQVKPSPVAETATKGDVERFELSELGRDSAS